MLKKCLKANISILNNIFNYNKVFLILFAYLPFIYLRCACPSY